jgi:hypothetical protein
MRSFRAQRKERYRLKMSAMGKASQRVQAARREAEMTPEILMDLAANPLFREGDSMGSLTWHNHRTGRVTKWIVERGPRVNNYRLRSPDGRKSKPHGMAWMLEKVRAVILRR